MEYEVLIKNIIDQVKEAQIKIGYARETVRLYYPVQSLNLMLGTNVHSGKEMVELLNQFVPEHTQLGKLRFSSHKDRVEVTVSPEGAEYVHKEVKEPAFLTDLIDLFRRHPHCDIEAIEQLFSSYSSDYVCKTMPVGSDFDKVYYFDDPNIDAWCYCVKEEMGHTIYHRFTKEDMKVLLEEDM